MTPSLGASAPLRTRLGGSGTRRGLVLFGALLLMLTGLGADAELPIAWGFLMTGVLGLTELLLLARRWPHDWSLSDTYASATLAWYGGGAWLGLSFADPEDLLLVSTSDYDALLFAGVFVMLGAAGMWLIAPFERRAWRRVLTEMAGPGRPIPPAVPWFILALTAVFGYFLIDGRIAFRSIGETSLTGERAIVENLVYQVATGLIAYLGWVVGKQDLPGRRFMLVITLALLPLLILTLLGEGRRPLTIQTLIFLMAMFYGRPTRPTWREIRRVGLMVVPLLMVGALLFQTQRAMLASADYHGEHNNLIDSVGNATEILSDDWETAIEWQAQNIPVRIFMIGYLQQLMLSTSPRFGLGAGAAAQFIYAIPSALLDGKIATINELGGADEERHPDFDLPVDDASGTLMTLAYMEFGWFGPVFAAVLVALMGLIWAGLMRLGNNDLFRWSAFGTLLGSHLSIEVSYLITIPGLLRVEFLLFPLYALLSISLDRHLERSRSGLHPHTEAG